MKNNSDWDQHLGVVLFAYYTTYKVNTKHIPFQVMYGLYSLMPKKYIVPTFTHEGSIINNSI